MKNDKWLEEKIKDLSPDAQVIAREIWECDNLEELEKLVRKWKKEIEVSTTALSKLDQ